MAQRLAPSSANMLFLAVLALGCDGTMQPEPRESNGQDDPTNETNSADTTSTACSAQGVATACDPVANTGCAEGICYVLSFGTACLCSAGELAEGQTIDVL